MTKNTPTQQQTIDRPEILEHIERLRAAVDEWNSVPLDRVPTTIWEGEPRRVVTEEIQERAAELFDFVATPDVAEGVRDLVLAVDAFEAAFMRWAKDCERRPGKPDPSGGNDVWAPYYQMFRFLAPRPRRVPTPIPVMRNYSTPVTLAQIARMYGWLTPDQKPDVNRVQREITAPGSEYDPETWIHPKDQERLDEINQRWQQRLIRLGAAKERAAEKRERPPHDFESLLRLPDIRAEQIAKMMKMTVEEVRRRAAELGKPLDSATVGKMLAADQRDRANPQAAAVAPRMTVHTFGELGDDLDARVLALFDCGYKHPNTIATLLQEAFPSVQCQGIAKILQDNGRTRPVENRTAEKPTYGKTKPNGSHPSSDATEKTA